MNLNLANKLQELNILLEETKVKATVTAKGIGNQQIRVDKELVVTDLHSRGGVGFNVREPNIKYSFAYEDISEVGGMDLDRITRAFNLNVDGTKRKTGKKPGRKPKNDRIK